MTPKRFFNLFVFTLFAALLSLTPALSTRAAPLRYTSITTNTVWDTDRSIDTDVVVQNGASLTINNGVTVYVDTGSPDPDPYADGLSNKVEIIVENGGALYVDGAILTANTAGSWYGLVFLPGSSGTVAGATIRHGTVGVTIQAASPTIHNNTIQDLRGNDGANPGNDGEFAAGIVISGTSTAQISSNTITNITAGNGADGADGPDGSAGNAGGDGGTGGDGSAALGIFVMDNLSAPTISDNIIENLTGGTGGWGGWGGGGQAGDPNGYSGGDGGYGGAGGSAIGITVTGAGANCVIERNLIRDVVGGWAGWGGDGGAGGGGFNDDGSNINGGNGGGGGYGGQGGDGGAVSGIFLRSSSAVVRDNIIENSLTGGDAGAGGWGGNGGFGGAGYAPSIGMGESGGNGGNGYVGGNAGNGGMAVGISVQGTSTADIRHNTLSAEITGGMALDGGWGGWGGDGGMGGNADVGIGGMGNGGRGGDGGFGGGAGDGGISGSAYGLMAQSGATPTLARNTVAYLRGGSSTSLPGQGGGGGYGGNGGTGSSGNGGNGGWGRKGGRGAEGSLGGAAKGIFVNADIRVENNLVYNLKGGDSGPGGPGGIGGNGGNGGAAAGPGLDGQGGFGGYGGDGGDGGEAGSSGGVDTYRA